MPDTMTALIFARNTSPLPRMHCSSNVSDEGSSDLSPRSFCLAEPSKTASKPSILSASRAYPRTSQAASLASTIRNPLSASSMAWGLFSNKNRYEPSCSNFNGIPLADVMSALRPTTRTGFHA